MSDFAGHSKAGLKAFFGAIVFILVIILWRENGEWLNIAKNLWRIPLCFGLTYLAALFPDIDIKSKSQKIIYLIIIVFMGLLLIYHYYGWAAGVGFFAALGIIFKHRGFLHTRWAAFLLPLPMLFIPLLITARLRDLGIEFYLATVIGYISHLKADQIELTPKFRIRKKSREKKAAVEEI